MSHTDHFLAGDDPPDGPEPFTTYACMTCGRTRRATGVAPSSAPLFKRLGCQRCGQFTRHGHDLGAVRPPVSHGGDGR